MKLSLRVRRGGSLDGRDRSRFQSSLMKLSLRGNIARMGLVKHKDISIFPYEAFFERVIDAMKQLVEQDIFQSSLMKLSLRELRQYASCETFLVFQSSLMKLSLQEASMRCIRIHRQAPFNLPL